MRVLSISTDRKIFQEGSAVRARMVEYGKLFSELHIVVFTQRFKNIKLTASSLQLAANVWVYPTNSWCRWFYPFDAARIARSIIENCKLKIENYRNDWVVSGQDPFECGLAAKWAAKKTGAKLHIQIHTDFLSPYFAASSFLNFIRVFIAKRILPCADAIRVVSTRIRDSLKANSLQLKASPIVLPIFTDLRKFQTAEPTFELKSRYPQWSFIILAVGRFSEEKNFGFAIRILKKLLKNYPKTGLVIVGGGPLEGRLKWKARTAMVEANVAFEPWQQDLISYYKTANLFLQTSLFEGFGLALLEAVASGCPAVSSDVGIAPELLNHKGHSFVCPVNDLDCFVQTISRLIEDNQLRTFFSLEIAPAAIKPFIQSKDKYLAAYKASLESCLVKSEIK